MLTGERCGRRLQRGAAYIIALVLASLVLTLSMSVVATRVILSENAQAEAAADAAAHAVVAEIAADPHRDDLSIATSGGMPCTVDSPVAQEIPSSDVSLQCLAAIAAGREVARANGARVIYLLIGPDQRDGVRDAGPGRLTALVEVALPRPELAELGACQSTAPTFPPCLARAFSSAQEAG